MRVALVLEPGGGGSARHVLDLAAGLAAQGVETHLAYSTVRAEPWFLEAVDALPIASRIDLRMRRAVGPWDLRAAMRLRAWLGRLGKVDVAHGHSSKAGALVRLATVGRARRIYTPHAFITMEPAISPAKRLVFAAAERALLALTDKLIACSEIEAEHAFALGARSNQVAVIANGRPPAAILDRAAARRALDLPDCGLILGWVGRMTTQKRPGLFVALMQRLTARGLPVTGVMIGDGPLLADVQAAVERAQLGPRLLLRQSGQAAALLPAFDALAVTSSFEGFAYLFLEALEAGIPVVSTDVGGARETIRDGWNGFVCPVLSPQALQDAAERVMTDASLRAFMAANAKSRAADFSIGTMIERTIWAYIS